ncbi:response regulator [Guptibacillus hwajinpoensis]|uniref:response regulator n=1 Tax=Guptibacillus hwajinpoensis TaxID=208199 RepID=UPI003D076DAA
MIKKTPAIIKVLLVEDEKDQLDMIEETIKDFNEEQNEHYIESTKAFNLEEALKALISEDYDAAILDLQLDKTKAIEDGLDGNHLIEIIKNKLRFPIFVRTGFPGKVTGREHSFFKVHTKDDDVYDILQEIKQIYTKGFTTTIGTKGKLEEQLNDIFWNQLSHNIEDWDQSILTEDEYERALVRYCITLLQEHLDLNENDDLDIYHPAEVYIKPPIKSNYYSGDILIDRDGKYFIILSPPCDMAQNKYEKVIIAEIEIENDQFNDFTSTFNNKDSTRKQKDSAYKSLTKMVKNNFSLRYHFLPKTNSFNGGFVNFQKLSSKGKEEIMELERVATVCEKFSKDITSRFSQYFSRQGQPDMNPNYLISQMTEKMIQHQRKVTN